ncbi:MAG: 2-oxoacid:acceptor oxidoreductase family protein [Pseudomonadota bacterium]|nr:2-oxoacid:acceptor oxidoreductase family protein [Pseudomonadota bacterium]
MYRIRFHGRGGQGMKTASRILGTACFLAGFEVQDAPRYGAERRGAPIFAYVRAGQAPIRERGIIRRPDLVVVADPTLVPIPAAGVLVGLDTHSLLLINSRETPQIWKGRLNCAGPVICFHPHSETRERSELPFVGTASAAAAARLLGFVELSHLEQAVQQELAGLDDPIVDKNLAIARRAHEQMAALEGRVREGEEASAHAYQIPDWIELPFEEARVSAPVIHAGLTSEAVPTGLWRTLRPVIDYDRCNRCWWVCSAFCPDGAIRVADGLPVIDYEHCKGCLVCMAQCPPHAIAALPEEEAAP